MKGLFQKALVLAGVSLFAITATYAAEMKTDMKHPAKKQMWVCTTNASSSSNAADQNADMMMGKTAKRGSEAFDFAMKHCRDCTKITCNLQTAA